MMMASIVFIIAVALEENFRWTRVFGQSSTQEHAEEAGKVAILTQTRTLG